MWGAFLFDEDLVVVVVVLGGCFGGEHRDLGDLGTTVYAKGLCSLGLFFGLEKRALAKERRLILEIEQETLL